MNNHTLQKEDKQDYSSESAILNNISLTLDKTLDSFEMSDLLKAMLTSIQAYASKVLVKWGKRDLLHVIVEDIREIHKDLLTNITGIYSTHENKISNLVDGHKHICRQLKYWPRKLREYT